MLRNTRATIFATMLVGGACASESDRQSPALRSAERASELARALVLRVFGAQAPTLADLEDVCPDCMEMCEVSFELLICERLGYTWKDDRCTLRIMRPRYRDPRHERSLFLDTLRSRVTKLLGLPFKVKKVRRVSGEGGLPQYAVSGAIGDAQVQVIVDADLLTPDRHAAELALSRVDGLEPRQICLEALESLRPETVAR